MFRRFSLALLLAAIAVFTLASKCEDCDNCVNGQCIEESICLCNPGFLGYGCESDGRIILPGSYAGNSEFSVGTNLMQQDSAYPADLRLTQVDGNEYYFANAFNTGDTLYFSVEDGSIILEGQALSPGTISGSAQVREYDPGTVIFWEVNWDRGNEVWRGTGALAR